MIGRVDRLSVRGAVDHWKAKGLDFTALFAPPNRAFGGDMRCTRPQSDRHKDHLDWEILRQVEPCFADGQPMKLEMPIRNIHRTVGAILSNRIVKRAAREAGATARWRSPFAAPPDRASGRSWLPA